jgi:hypothetical protein
MKKIVELDPALMEMAERAVRAGVYAVRDAEEMAREALAAAKEKLGIRSPSPSFIEIGCHEEPPSGEPPK